MLRQLRQHLIIVEVFEEHRRVHNGDRVDELREALAKFLDDLSKDELELFVGDLL